MLTEPFERETDSDLHGNYFFQTGRQLIQMFFVLKNFFLYITDSILYTRVKWDKVFEESHFNSISSADLVMLNIKYISN